MIYIIGHIQNIEKFHNKIFIKNGIKYKYLHVKLLAKEHEDDAILQMHGFLNEYVGQYYAHKYELEENINDGYIGFCHYRRLINPKIFSEIDIIKNKQTYIFDITADVSKSDDEKLLNLYKKNNCKNYWDYCCYFWRNIDIFEDFIKTVKDKNILSYFTKSTNNVGVLREIYLTSDFILFENIINTVNDYIDYVIKNYNIDTSDNKTIKNSINELCSKYDKILFSGNMDEFKSCWWYNYNPSKRLLAYNIEIIIGIILGNYENVKFLEKSLLYTPERIGMAMLFDIY